MACVIPFIFVRKEMLGEMFIVENSGFASTSKGTEVQIASMFRVC